jgi:hypothetical protein
MSRGPVIKQPVSLCCQESVFVEPDTEGVMVASCERCSRSYTMEEAHAGWARAGFKSAESLHRKKAMVYDKIRAAMGLPPC